MTVSIISPDDFIRETKRWGIGPNSLIRVRLMQKGELIYARFAIPNTYEILETRIPLERFQKIDFMNLIPISIPAVWETVSLADVNKRLEELNASPKYSTFNQNQSIRHK